MNRNPIMAAVTAISLGLAACGDAGEDAGSGDTASDVAQAASSTAGGVSGWNAADACTLVGQDRLAAAVGVAVNKADLVSTTAGTADTATISTCNFTLADGRIVSVLTRQSPLPDVTEKALADARTMGGNMPAATDVTNVGEHAFWTEQVKTLQVFYDETRYATISVIGSGNASVAFDTAKQVAKLL